MNGEGLITLYLCGSYEPSDPSPLKAQGRSGQELPYTGNAPLPLSPGLQMPHLRWTAVSMPQLGCVRSRSRSRYSSCDCAVVPGDELFFIPITPDEA